MLVNKSKRPCIGRSKRSSSAYTFNDSWKSFYTSEGDLVGRGGAAKVFCVKPNEGALKIDERKISIDDTLHDGTFGQNFEVINVAPNGKQLAVKIIRRFRGGRDSIEKIRNEIELMKSLQMKSSGSVKVPSSASPFLVSVHEDPVEVAIVMEYARGGSLFDLCHQQRELKTMLPSENMSKPTPESENNVQSNIPESYFIQVLERIANALVYMHEKANIVHLDIKAENILLREPYPSPDVFITDFGLASILNKSKPHRELAGTPDYTAPEVISYDPVTFATDMWSVGVLTYFMLTGVSPFLADTKALTMSNIIRMKIEYPEHLFAHVPTVALDFIKSLIRTAPRQRLTAAQCLKHEWLQKRPVSEPAPFELPKTVVVDSDVEKKVTKPSPKRFALVDDPNPPEAISISKPPITVARLPPPFPLDVSVKRKLVKQTETLATSRGLSETRGNQIRRSLDFYLRLPSCIIPSVRQPDCEAEEHKTSLSPQVPLIVNSPVD